MHDSNQRKRDFMLHMHVTTTVATHCLSQRGSFATPTKKAVLDLHAAVKALSMCRNIGA